jgi:hypothetical protein
MKDSTKTILNVIGARLRAALGCGSRPNWNLSVAEMRLALLASATSSYGWRGLDVNRISLLLDWLVEFWPVHGHQACSEGFG